jgi:CelD/BcsL family acetyltransferase involved in cellulose biosynthesis
MIERLDPLSDPRWARFVDRVPGALIFHHPAWIRLVAGQYGYPISAWVMSTPGGDLAAGLPVALRRSRITGTQFIALPFSDACPPLIDPASGVGPGEFARRLDDERKARGLDLEVRAGLPADGAVVSKTFVSHRLALERDVAAVEARFAKRQVKRGIAKALREGVAIERRADPEGLRRFYRLHALTRRRQGVPTQPKRFIMQFAELFDLGLGFVLIARHRSRDASAAVFLSVGGTLTYQFGASDPRHLTARPNNLLFMEAIRWGCESGHHTLDLGRTDLDNHGLRAFKSSWGAVESPLFYSRFGPPVGVNGGRHLRRLMHATIPRAPTLFGRLVGTALYRHFA